MTVNEERVVLLADALDSGEYVQGKGHLHRRSRTAGGDWEHTWCCLGVAGDVAASLGLEFTRRWMSLGYIAHGYPDTETEMMDGADTHLGPRIMAWYGFTSANPALIVPPELQAGLMQAYATRTAPEVPRLLAANWNDCRLPGADHSFTAIAAAFRATYLGGGNGAD